jgi:YtkA-like
MVTHRLVGAFALALVAVPVVSCGSGATSSGGSTTTVATSLCDTDPRAMTYAVGLSQTATGGAVKVTFVDAQPAPPAENENQWTVELTDANGNPVTGATITVKPFMPDMGHGSSVTPQIMPMATDGMYQITLLDLFMPGIWTNTFTITTASEPAATVVFTFCIDG